MKSVEYSINVKKGNLIQKAKFILTSIENGQTLVEYIDEQEHLAEVDAHTYSAFNRIRERLNLNDKWLLVKGGRNDVHPSGRQLSWIYAYKLVLGKRVDPQKDLVIIFEPELDYNNIASIQEQKEYYKKWLESIKGIPY